MLTLKMAAYYILKWAAGQINQEVCKAGTNLFHYQKISSINGEIIFNKGLICCDGCMGGVC